MTRVLIVHASRHGGTRGIAERLGEVLRTDGFEAVVADAAAMPETRDFDAYLVGSAVYMGSWLKDAIDFVERKAATLASRPVWFFSSGPLPGSSRSAKTATIDPLDEALGPTEGPGSRGHQQVIALSRLVHPREHRVFLGRFDPTDPPQTFPERIVRLLPISKGILPAGDFREWDKIEAWGHQIAIELDALSVRSKEPVLV